MDTGVIVAPGWSTASFSGAALPSHLELSALGEHLNLCRGSLGRLFPLQCVVESMRGFMAARLITTLAVLALLAGIGSLMLP